MEQENTIIFEHDSQEDAEAIINTLCVYYPVVADVFPTIPGLYTRKECVNVVETFLNVYNNHLGVHRKIVARKAFVEAQEKIPLLEEQDYYVMVNTFLVIYLTVRKALKQEEIENGEFIENTMMDTIIGGVTGKGHTIMDNIKSEIIDF
jgi:hypothetical protein